MKLYKFFILSMLFLSILFPKHSIASNFPHLKTACVSYGLNNASDELLKEYASRFDFLIGPHSSKIAKLKAFNPNLKMIAYDNFTNLPDRVDVKWQLLEEYCFNNSVDLEDMFAHFSEDTILSMSGTPFENKLGGYRVADYSTNVAGLLVYDGISFKNKSGGVGSYPANVTIGNNTSSIIYFGHWQKFYQLSFLLSVKAVGWDGVWEYWNGTFWSSLSVKDETLKFTKDGNVKFIPPSNWRWSKINGVFGGYWIRLRTTSSGSTLPIASSIKKEGYYIYQGSSGKYLVPGWDSLNDRNGDGFVDDSEFSALVNPKATARFKYQARIPTFYWAPERYVNNLGNYHYRIVNANYVELATSTLYNGLSYDGIFEDNCTFTDGSTSPASWGWDKKLGSYTLISGGRVIEYPGESPGIQFTKDHLLVDEMAYNKLKSLGKILIGNSSQLYADNPNINYAPLERITISNGTAGGYFASNIHDGTFREFWMIPKASISYQGEWSDPIQGLRSQVNYANDLTINGNKLGFFHVRSSESTNPADFPVERERMYALAYFYLINDNKNAHFVFTQGNNFSSYWWWKAIEYNIGMPLGGVSEWASGTDSAGQAYYVYSREYSKALILVKPLPKWDSKFYDSTSPVTTHELNGSYQRLNYDGTLSSPMTQISLKNVEAAILIKTNVTSLPAPPPTIVPSPVPEPAPEPAPVVEEPSPSPTPEPTPAPVAESPKPNKEKEHTNSKGGNKDNSNAGGKVYVAVSEISSEGEAIGNVKKYEVTNGTNVTVTNNTNENSTNTSNGVQVVDATNTPVLDSNNLIKDSSTSAWSSSSDGKKVDKGGVGEVLLKRTKPRKILTNIDHTNGSNGKSELYEFSTSNEKITPEMLGFPSEDKTSRDKLIQYIHGYDTYSNLRDKEKTSLQKRKWILGSIINSRPLVVPYGKSKRVIFVGANDGMLHAFDDKTGEELWGFIPSELLGQLKEMPNSKTPKYYVDGSPKVYLTNSQKIIVFGLRRGGNHYYAMDVTDPYNPKFLYKIGPETIGFSEMGQTWSEPQFVRIRYGKEIKAALVIGGGYDENQDRKTPASEDRKGRAVYVVDLLTGQQIWRWDYKRDPNMKNSIPSTVACVDVSGDGLIDRLYVGDLGGKLWRFDLNGADPKEWSGRVIFNSNLSYTGSNKNKIFNKPDVTLEKGHQIVYFGTGDREHPYERNGVDRFYAVMDRGNNSILSTDNLADVTKDFSTVQTLANKEGWFISLEKGEKVLAPPVVAFGVVYFSTFTPSQDSDGIARIYALNYRTGNPIFNLNPENDVKGPKIDLSDRSKVIGTGIPSGTVISAIGGKPFAYTGFPGGLYSTHLKAHSTIIPISWREVSVKKKGVSNQ